MTFSERIGIEKGREVIQLESMDDDLRVALFNLVHDAIQDTWYYNGKRGQGYAAARRLWTDLWHRSVDDFPATPDGFIGWVKPAVLKRAWNAVYDLVEFLHKALPRSLSEDRLNRVLEREMSGYRASGGLIAPISDRAELQAVEEALAVSNPFSGARSHIAAALRAFRRNPVQMSEVPSLRQCRRSKAQRASYRGDRRRPFPTHSRHLRGMELFTQPSKRRG